MTRTLTAIAVTTVLAACGGNPAPGDEGYAYNVSGEYAAEFIADDGTVITGTVTMATARGGAVTGKLALDNPFTVTGDIEGVIDGSEMSLTMPYAIEETGCTGVASGIAQIAEGGGSLDGMIDIADDCGEAPSTATFSLVR